MVSVKFTDVSADDYFYDAVTWAVQNGITNGTDSTHFSPYDTCTSNHILTFLYRVKGEPGKTYSGAWYDDAVNWAEKQGMLDNTGIWDTSSNCARKNVVYFLWKADSLSNQQETYQSVTEQPLSGGGNAEADSYVTYNLNEINEYAPPANTLVLNGDRGKVLLYLADINESYMNSRNNVVYTFCTLDEQSSQYRQIKIYIDDKLSDWENSAEIEVFYINFEGSRTSYRYGHPFFTCTLSTCENDATKLIGEFSTTVRMAQSAGGYPDLTLSCTFHIDTSEGIHLEAARVYGLMKDGNANSYAGGSGSSDYDDDDSDSGSSSSGRRVHVCGICGSDDGECKKCNGRGWVKNPYYGYDLNAPATIECVHCNHSGRCPNYFVY